MMRLTKSELEIMEVLWAADEPCAVRTSLPLPGQNLERQLCPHPAEQHAEEKAIQEAGFVRRGKGYGRVFTPAISEEAYFAGNLFNRKDSAQLSRLFAGLVNSDGVTPALLDELEGMIQTRRNELNK